MADVMLNAVSNAEFTAVMASTPVTPQDFRANLLAGKSNVLDQALAQLKVYWPGVKGILRAVKAFTGPRIDRAIDAFIAALDRLLGGATGDEKSKLLDLFAANWRTIRHVLENFKLITPPKTDALIDEVIKIGDLLANS